MHVYEQIDRNTGQQFNAKALWIEGSGFTGFRIYTLGF